MPAAARLGDKAQVDADAHGCPACPHPGIGPIVTASTDVFVNKKGAARQDDLGIHAVCCGPNNFTVVKGSPTVYVNGKPVELRTECKDPKGQLRIEIWAQSADRAQDKKVKSESAGAAKSVKKKVKLEIPPDAAAGNECHFYFVVKDEQGGEHRSDTL